MRASVDALTRELGGKSGDTERKEEEFYAGDDPNQMDDDDEGISGRLALIVEHGGDTSDSDAQVLLCGTGGDASDRDAQYYIMTHSYFIVRHRYYTPFSHVLHKKYWLSSFYVCLVACTCVILIESLEYHSYLLSRKPWFSI